MLKAYYVFYENVFKAVVGKGAWKHCIAKGSRLGTSILEAFAHIMLKNNYFTWLYDYKLTYPGTKLRTEYDFVEQTTKGEDSDESAD